MVIVDVDPRAVALDDHRSDIAARRAGEVQRVYGLSTIELLNGEVRRIRRPIHSRQIIVAWIAGDLHPRRRSACRTDDANSSGGVGRTGLRILYGNRERIERVRVVDQQKITDAAGVELPVRDVSAVRTPA